MTYVAQCLGPMAFLKIFPTSGVTEENVHEFFCSGMLWSWVCQFVVPTGRGGARKFQRHPGTGDAHDDTGNRFKGEISEEGF